MYKIFFQMERQEWNMLNLLPIELKLIKIKETEWKIK